MNKLLTGYQLAASPCQACSISRSHIVEAAAVGTVVFWKLMPGASAKWRLMVCDLSRGWPSEHTHGGGCLPCRRSEPAISFTSVSTSFLTVWVLCMQMSQVGLAASVQSQVHLYMHLLSLQLGHSHWSTWVLALHGDSIFHLFKGIDLFVSPIPLSFLVC